MSRIFELKNGKRLEYRIYGDITGYTILGCHGLIGTVEMDGFDEQIAGLPANYILIARPGYGESDYYTMSSVFEWTNAVGEFMDALNIERCDVIGMSAGAVYAYALAAAFPGRVKSLYMYSGLGAIYKQDVLDCYQKTEEVKNQVALFQNGSVEEIADFLNNYYIKPMSKEMLENRAVMDSICNNCLGMAQTTSLEFKSWGFRIEDVTQLVELFHSRADEEAPYSMAKKTMEHLQNAKIHTYEGEPHNSDVIMADIMKKLIIKHCGIFKTLWIMLTRNFKRDYNVKNNRN